MNSKASDVSEELRELRARAKNPRDPEGWRVHDQHFFDWLSENMGPENVAYLKALVKAGATLSPPLPSLEVERRALKLLARHTCFSAYSAAEPLCIHFDFGSEADRIAAANALDEAFAALSALPLDGGL